jgi:hypothetical protein
MTGLEVVDTAVKVGLGALISGIASYLMARQANAHNLRKTRCEEDSALFKEAILKLEKSASSMNAATHSYDLFIRGRVEKVTEALELALAGYNEAKDAKALLYLVGADDLAVIVQKYIEAAEHIRETIDTQSTSPSPSQSALDKFVSEAVESRRGLFRKVQQTRKKIREGFS